MKCEELLLAKMAELDGEWSEFSIEAVDAHLLDCASCRSELEMLLAVNETFDRHMRVEHDANVWPAVQRSLVTQRGEVRWRTFAVFALALAAFKIVAMSMENDPGWLIGLVPLVLAATLFAVLKENPFKVNTELLLESNHG
jgi:anti-sigma factor RsiW